MSIATKTGDNGTTGLLFNRRVRKTHPRIEACGAVDELNAALGLARAVSPSLNPDILAIQKTLVVLMGELAVLREDSVRYESQGFRHISPDQTRPIDSAIAALEARQISYKDWATPGDNLAAASLEMARTACRRAERRVCALLESGEVGNVETLVYLNRLSDLLWLLARAAETPPQPT